VNFKLRSSETLSSTVRLRLEIAERKVSVLMDQIEDALKRMLLCLHLMLIITSHLYPILLLLALISKLRLMHLSVV
jgi:hypothetical protein